MSSFSTQASDAAEQYLTAVAKVQDASIEAVSNFAANLPEAAKNAAKNVPALPATDLPSAEEISAVYYDFTEKLVANQKAYVERYFAAVTAAS
jgi:hypothetical protein